MACKECHSFLNTTVCVSCKDLCFYCKEHAHNHFSNTKHCLFLDLPNKIINCSVCKEFTRLCVHKKKPKQQITSAKKSNCLGLRGIINLGNTCFMNSVLQSFLHNPFIKDFFLMGKHNDDENCPLMSGQDFCMVCESEEILSSFLNGDSKPVVPNKFLYSSWISIRNLAGYEQQDAHEFFIALLNTLHLHSGGSAVSCNCIIHQNFTGALQSDVTCSQCGTTSTAYDPFLDISLDLNSQFNFNSTNITSVLQSIIHGNGTPESSFLLSDCLQRYTHAEKLGCKYFCGNCNTYQESVKQLTLCSLPKVLSFHLKVSSF